MTENAMSTAEATPITLEELTKRIEHQLWAVQVLAKTKQQKIRAEGQTTALNTVLYWITHHGEEVA